MTGRPDTPLVVVTDGLPAPWSDGQPPGSPLDDALAAGLRPLVEESGGTWVGWPGRVGTVHATPPTGPGPLPVPLTEADLDEHLRGHSDSTLWPIYHDALDRPTFHRRWRQAYHRVNGRYARLAAAAAAPAAQVWIHGHRLQLVPGMLRQLRPDLRIGFFLHTPFPPAELFTRLPARAELLTGLLGADLIGFQRPGGAANLLRACREVLGTPTDAAGVHLGGRTIEVAHFRTGVDSQRIARIAALPAVRARAVEIRAHLGQPGTVLLGIDSLDVTQGTEHRLAAFAGLLRAGHLDGDDTVLVQVVLPDAQPTTARRALRDRIEHHVGRINGDHARVGGPLVHYLYQPHSLAERVALYLAADVMTVTALREGTSLVAKEYVAARAGGTGTLLLSEMTGAAADLPDAFLVNPHDADALRATLLAAVRHSPDQQAARIRRMLGTVDDHDVHRWAAEFRTRLTTAAHTLLEAHT